MLDVRTCEVDLAEIHLFDRVSKSLKRIVYEKGSKLATDNCLPLTGDADIIKQYEYIHKGMARNPYRAQTRQSLKENQALKTMNESIARTELARANEAIRRCMEKTRDLEL